MTDDTADKIAALEKEVAALKAKSTPTPTDPRETERSIAEHIDRMHQMREGRMSFATPPSVAQYFSDGVTPADCADIRQQAHRPTGRPGMVPDSNVRGAGARASAGDGTGWAREVPIGVPGGTRTHELIERAVNAALPHGPEWGKEKK
jgi:hypothetical protein